MAMYAENTVDGTWAGWLKFTATLKGADKSYNYLVRPEILDSWVRCRQAKVNPNDEAIHHRLETASLQVMLRKNKDLITIAKPFMDNLYQIVAGSGFVVALTDVRGYVMEIFGDKDTLTNPMTESFFQGASWSEAEAGTNAIGTTLVTGKPIQVSGSEHYCRKHHCLTCSAAPILDEWGNVLGTLDVSGKSTAAHLHTLGMVMAAAEAIMAQLGIRKKNKELSVINNRLTNIFNTMSDGVIMVDNNGVISDLNPVAKKILGFGINKSEDTRGVQVESILGTKNTFVRRMLMCKESCPDTEVLLDINGEVSQFWASGEPVTDEQGIVTGGVVILRPIKRIQNLVNRFNGNYGTLQFSDIIGESKAILEAVRIASLAATSISSVLLQGESGTGKEIFAQAIHNRSERNAGLLSR